jgi:arginase family enzyme
MGTPLLETFLGAPRTTASDLSPDAIAVLGLPHDVTKISRRGAVDGPRALREATSMFHFAVTEMAGGEVVDIDRRQGYTWSDAPVFDLGDLALGSDVPQNMETIAAGVREVVATGALPVLLGGDHFVTYPAVTGLASGRGAAPAYLHVDMHLDLADSLPGYGRHASGTPLRRLIEAGVLDPARVAIVGVEAFQHRSEWNYAVDMGIEVVSAEALRAEGVEECVRRLYDERLSGTPDGVYVSLDIDVLARAYAPGTGNAVGLTGLLPDELAQLVRVVSAWPLAGIDLVEVSPRLDPTGRTAGLGASLLIDALHPRLFTESRW